MNFHVKLNRRTLLVSVLATFATAISKPLFAQNKFRYIPTQYIATLASAEEKSGTGAEKWGLWRVDPGPIGVWLRFYQFLQKAGNIAPAGWRFDIDDWWLDENGLIMKAPEFPIPPGQYYVTNGEDNISKLTVEKPDPDGKQAWSLSDGKSISDITHGPCRSARYTPKNGSRTCSPKNANRDVFPLKPGEHPPYVEGCNRKNYAVLIVFALPNES